MTQARLPNETHMGYAHLRVANLERSLTFYRDQLGLREIRRQGSTVYLSATGAEPAHIALTEQADAVRKNRRTIGLYHVAILFPSRQTLAETFRNLIAQGVQFGGFSDHLVSEALYLDDPDGNGIELYRDRPREEWRMNGSSVEMATEPLDVHDLLGQAGDSLYDGVDLATQIGHIHLHVSNLATAEAFYSGVLGFDVMQRSYPGALFISAGGYHHHIGLNTWAGKSPAPANAVGLINFSVVVPDADAQAALIERANAAGAVVETVDGRTYVRDQDNNQVEIAVA